MMILLSLVLAVQPPLRPEIREETVTTRSRIHGDTVQFSDPTRSVTFLVTRDTVYQLLDGGASRSRQNGPAPFGT
jgi:hypothetical protein